MPAGRATATLDPAELAARVRAVLRGSDWVLVKGSRSMRMERIVQALARPDDDAGATPGSEAAH
jgi:UDP-N-acetylmuramyl pentapeptide synthase